MVAYSQQFALRNTWASLLK